MRISFYSTCLHGRPCAIVPCHICATWYVAAGTSRVQPSKGRRPTVPPDPPLPSPAQSSLDEIAQFLKGRDACTDKPSRHGLSVFEQKRQESVARVEMVPNRARKIRAGHVSSCAVKQ
eukprot:3415180-Pleurochrysis_carterae.AAC.1